MDRERLCRFYFDLGLSYAHILEFLAQAHGIVISLRTLKRILRRHGLFRRKFHADLLTVATFIQEQLNDGSQLGYRSMHLRCRQNRICVSRDTVSILMQILDPLGIECRIKRRLRRRKYFASGPNFLWHVDSYDKLKKYGICINGCIDGFSRHTIWLNAYKTSSDPRIVAGYFMESVSKKEGSPHLIRGDMGTENGHVAQMQEFLTEREGSFIYGKSTSNQRIEMLWCFFRRQCSQYWIDTLGTLKDQGHFTGNLADVSLMQFCFLHLIQKDIDRMVIEWNSHNIRPSKSQNCPSGRPVVMYRLPNLYNTRNYLNPVLPIQIQACREECTFRTEKPCDDEFFELYMLYIEQLNKEVPLNVHDALDLYLAIRRELYNDL